jgi:hypothetical protein
MGGGATAAAALDGGKVAAAEAAASMIEVAKSGVLRDNPLLIGSTSRR